MIRIKINKKLIKYNFSSRTGNPIKYLVIHDTGNTDKGAGANSHYLYFNGGNRQASAHYFVDDKEILQVVEDSNASWHCGDGKGKYGITNQNSIGIEICINSDGDYDKAVENAVKLTEHLMEKYNIPIENVVRHYDASRKICPHSMSKNNWETWYEFKAKLGVKDVGEKHWADVHYDNLNKKGIEIHEKRLDDNITRGEVFALLDRLTDKVEMK